MAKKIGIMQPYFFPYLGYWQLMNAVDEFVVYDNIQYTKKGWFNRNRFLQNGKDALFSINIEKDSDYLDVKDRKISKEFNRQSLVSKLYNAYLKAPYFKENFEIIQNIILFNNNNLFEYLYNSICMLHKYFEMQSQIVVSSSLDIDNSLKSKEKVKAIVKFLDGTHYINPIGGMELYSKEDFSNSGINLHFLKMNNIEYPQFKNEFIPSLSIIDVMMFNSPEQIKQMLNEYELISKI